jgi:cobalamin biosynthesis protein CobD/CbiB
VAEAFEVPLAFLMTPAHHRRHVFDLRRRRSGSSCPCPGRGRGARGDYFIWGATAAMLRNLYRFLALPDSRASRWGRCALSSNAMSFFAVLFALLIEQLKPLPRDNWVHDTLVAWVRWTGRNFDAGKPHHTRVVWCVSVLVPALVAWGVYLLVARYSLLLALAFDVGVLYLTLGFPPVQPLLHRHPRRAGPRRRERGAQLLAEWRHLDASELPRTELLRHVIEHALLAAHRHVFGVFFWFVVLSAWAWARPGPCCTAWPSSPAVTGATASRTLDAPANDRPAGPRRSRLFSNGSTTCRRG